MALAHPPGLFHFINIKGKSMSHTILNQVSDDDLRHAYQSRFRAEVGEILDNGRATADHLSTYFNGHTTEGFAVIFLNSRNAIIATEIMFEGTVNQASIYPREIIKRALELNAVSLIIGHNHPSGQLQPSVDDRRITGKIQKACQTMDMNLLDHLIITDSGWMSFEKDGILQG